MNLLKNKTLRLKATVKLIFILVSMIDMEVTKTNTSFLKI